MNSEHLLDRARAGDVRARNRLVADHLAWIRRVVIRCRPPRHLVEDLVQEAAMRVVRVFDKFDGSRSFPSFVAAHVRYAVLDYYRENAGGGVVRLPRQLGERMRTRGEKVERVCVQWPSVEDDRGELVDWDVADPSRAFDVGVGDRDAVRALLASLDPRSRLVVRLYYGLGGGQPRTQEQIAALLGIVETRVSQLLGEARRKMRARATTAAASA